MTASVQLAERGMTRLPPPKSFKMFNGLQGALLLQPWYDWCAVRAVVNWYMPLSRAWAAALESRGDPEEFNNALGTGFTDTSRLRSALRKSNEAAKGFAENQAVWDKRFFGQDASSSAELLETETRRQELSEQFMLQRKAFWPWRRQVPKVKWELPSAEAVEQRHGHRLRKREAAFEVPPQPDFEVSRSIEGQWENGSAHRQKWLRFPSAVAGDTAWAKLYEPIDPAPDAPCVIFLHGIAMETDWWGEVADPVNELTEQGFTVIRPEAPWHGHRRCEGWHGGENVIAHGPAGFLDLFHGWVTEIAMLIQWARARGARSVAVGGLSLGALTAQSVATAARSWSKERQPDALLLVTTSEDMLKVTQNSSMASLLEVPKVMSSAGWSQRELARWMPLLEPHGDPVMSPDRIVVQLGQADDLTHYESGVSLVQRWHVPEDNVFHRRRQGHYTTNLGLYRNRSALKRFVSVVNR